MSKSYSSNELNETAVGITVLDRAQENDAVFGNMLSFHTIAYNRIAFASNRRTEINGDSCRNLGRNCSVTFSENKRKYKKNHILLAKM